MSTKRPRRRQAPSPDRSPSPLLPAHLYSALPASSSSATVNADSSGDPTLAHLALHAIEAREATLLDPRDWPEAVKGTKVEWTGWVDSSKQGDDGEQKHVWTDRYDLLHLLPSIPPIPRLAPPDSAQSTTQSGFDDLPSDHEEMFFLNSRAERADVERKKKRRRLEEERERRVRERMKEDGEEEEADVLTSDGDEPPKEIHLLMSRLHTTLSRSPNPALLELRILANHGSDARFASFLKREGRWREAWERMRRGEAGVGQGESGDLEKEGEEGKAAPKVTTALGGLADYGSDSDAESDDDNVGNASAAGPDKALAPSTFAGSPPGAETPTVPPETSSAISSIPAPAPEGDSALVEDLTEEQRKRQETRAAKAREWAQRRREARKQGGSS